MSKSITTIKTKIAKLDEQIAKLSAERAELNDQLSKFVDVSTLDVGDTITFVYGRKDKRTTRTATVVGLAYGDAEKPTRVRAAIGEGFEAELVTITSDIILSIVKAA